MAFIDIDLDEFDSAELLEELKNRGAESYKIIETGTLVDSQKAQFFIDHIDKIKLEDLENIVSLKLF